MTAFESALADIDALHAEDPDGAELRYAQRMTAWLERQPDASPELRLAVRAQHLKRWELPRADFPEGRVGYKKWRAEQARRHAALTASLLEKHGFDGAVIERVAALIQKRRLGADPEAQTLEDVACLTFLEHEFAAFARKHPTDKVVDIVPKTWTKMSERARQLALQMTLGDGERDLLGKALADPGTG